MARFNKILRGPVDQNKPQVREAICTTAVLPGTAVVISGANLAQAGANALTPVYIVQDNYLALKGVDDAWPANDRIVAIHPQDDEVYALRVPTGQNLVAGDNLTTSAAGKFVKSTTGQRTMFWVLETYNNNTGADQLVNCRVANTNLPAA